MGELRPAMSARAPDVAPRELLGSRLWERLRAPRRTPAASAPRAQIIGTLGLAALLACSLLVVVVASGQKTILVPQSDVAFPAWLAGPLHQLTHGIAVRSDPTAIGFSVVLVAMTAAYAIVVVCARSLPARVAISAIVVLHVIWLLAPPMPLSDLFNYLGYARLGGLHGLNPYTHGIAAAGHDAVEPFVTWQRLRSPYGPLFMLASTGLGPLPLPLAYWLMKLATVAASLGVVALLWRCARQLGRDPLPTVLLYAVNPLVLVYALGGFHNDVFLLLFALGAISLLLERRDAGAGAALACAIAVKASAGVLLPFLLLGARRRGRFALGAGAAALPLAAVSVLAYGGAHPNLSDQTSLLSSFSVPNALGQLSGLGGAPPWLLTGANVLLVLVVAALAAATWRGRIDWLPAAGWATFALILSLAWLQPWYAMWLLPLAALAGSRALTRATLAVCAYLLLTFLPVTGMALSALDYKPMDSPVGRASIARMHALQWQPVHHRAHIFTVQRPRELADAAVRPRHPH